MKRVDLKSVIGLVLGLFCFTLAFGQSTFKEFKGMVIDNDSRRSLEFVNLTVKNTNIATVTNSEGEFVIKIPENFQEGIIIVSHLGYSTREIQIQDLKPEDNKIRMYPSVTQLSEISISAYRNASRLVKQVFENRAQNNHNNPVLMTAFYRETIKKRNRNVSLTEAVVNVHKQSYTTGNRDVMEIHKARKTTDYKRLDTLSVKLKGGPFSNVYLDIMKYPEYIFAEETIDDYNYDFDESTNINGRPVYVVNFEAKPNTLDISYYGKLYIDVQSIALVSADYSLDISDQNKVRNVLVEKKPTGFIAYPTKADYHVDYKEKDGRWYYSYSSVDLSFKINKKRQLFNAVYTLSSEMAITDWIPTENKSVIDSKNRLKPSVIISDEITGFSDPDFWGDYNLIEPEKSIESAIDKIRRKLNRTNQGTSIP